jgi:RNA polymerase primary sigma factor
VQESLSLKPLWGEEEDSIHGDFIEDKDVDSPANTAAHRLLNEQIWLFSTLFLQESKSHKNEIWT